MKKTILLIALILMLSVTTVNNVRAQTENSPVSAVGNWRPGDAHVHSIYSHCPPWPAKSGDSIGKIAQDARNSGLDWIIITDHSYDIDATKWQTAQERCEAASDTEFLVVCGEELSVDEGGTDVNAGHYLSYGLDDFIGNSGSPPGSPWWPHEPDAQDGIDLVKSQQGVGFIAHPYNSRPVGPWEIGIWDWDSWNVASGYTGIEVWNGGMDAEDPDGEAMQKWNNLLVGGLASGQHVVGIGNSDAHPGLNTPSPYEHSVFTFLNLPSITDDAPIIDAYKGGHAIFSNGPFVSFEIEQHIVGETVGMTKGSQVTLDVSWDALGHGTLFYIEIYKGTSAGVSLYDRMPLLFESGDNEPWVDPEPVDESCFYRLELHEYDSSYSAYTNPIWINLVDDFTEAIVVNTDAVTRTSRSGDSRAFHSFTSPVGFLSATDGDTFDIISTGIAANTPGSPEHFESTDFGAGGTADDTISLTLEMVVPSGATTLSFDFRFMSEEYPEYVGSAYNDFFYTYLTNSSGKYQIAFDDNGHIINVNNNFFNPGIYPVGTVFDGTTKRLTTTENVHEEERITLQFMVGDVGDGVYDTAVFLDNVRFNVESLPPGTTPTADVIVVVNGPNNVEQGKQFTYTISYFNIEEGVAEDVHVLALFIDAHVTFVSASNGGVYEIAGAESWDVLWSLGTMQPFSSGSLTLTVAVPNTTPVGTVLSNVVFITTPSQQSGDPANNEYTKETIVSGGSSLPPSVDVGPTVSNYNGIPVLYWTTPTTFTYHGDASVVGVNINIHLPDGGPDIGGPMTNLPGTYDWKFTYTFYPRHGQGTVTYTVHYADGQQSATVHSILVDPSGYVYNAITGQRIQGATVTLYRFNIALQQFVLIAPGDPGIEPHINPQITDENGGYGWMVSPGMYMVKAEKTGYATNFVIVTVPPPATDLNIPLTPIDTNPPTTQILVGEPHYIDASDNMYVTSATSFTLVADDGPDGSGVAATYYRQYNVNYDSDWKEQPNPFYLTGLDDGDYSIDFYSTDAVGNVEPTNTQDVILDNTAPSLTVETPAENDALQDGVTFKVSAWDLSAVASVTFSIQCPQGNIISPEFQSMPATLGADGQWSLYFDTRQLLDGFYLFVANGTDVLGNWGTTTAQFSIRNWATIELLPASETNKAGRTMPVKFSIRVKASVDSAQPFIHNEELTIKIYRKGYPGTILQTSTYGTTSRDYRIDSIGEKYITNFKTLSTPATYVVEIYRKGMLIGSFEFKTVK